MKINSLPDTKGAVREGGSESLTNPTVAPVHNRMPLILEPEELKDWVLDDQATESLLHKTPVLLEQRAEYEQMRLF